MNNISNGSAILREAAYEEGYKAGKTLTQTERLEAFNEGYSNGKLATIVALKSKLHEVAATSPANDYESRYENLVIMLSDVDRVINEMLED